MLEQLNKTLFLLINQFAGNSYFLDLLVIGLAEYMPYLFIFILACYWFKAEGLYRGVVVQAGCTLVFALILSYLISLFYVHDRPFVAGLGTTLVEHAADSSFPSDHTTFIFAISWVLFSEKETRNTGIGLLFLSLLSGLSRVVVGVHFPFDIMAAAVVSGVALLGVQRSTYLKRLRSTKCML